MHNLECIKLSVSMIFTDHNKISYVYVDNNCAGNYESGHVFLVFSYIKILRLVENKFLYNIKQFFFQNFRCKWT